ncbi:MAG: aminopeptidase [Bdellovibrionales bacterium]|jgi:predicted aminopeptidase|nr:aminopeptidase [Bdellovibrionales bacterium]
MSLRLGPYPSSTAFRAGFALLFLIVFLPALLGCQAPYILKSAWSQADLLTSRKSIETILAETPETAHPAASPLPTEDREKLKLARDAKAFGERVLGLKKTKNYDTFVQLDRPYVSYVVSASAQDRLEQHLWKFPIIGAVPYKGYFDPGDAEKEELSLKEKGLDTYLRGVSAYSTLGWFNDPVLSSMLRYSDYDLVNTIIHESVHATLYIKSQADFNERLATYIGNIGADLFFLEREGPSSATVKAAKQINQDEALFSAFISTEIDALKRWYEENAIPGASAVSQAPFLERRLARLGQISENFETELRPKLKNERYARYLSSELKPERLNNARLLAWRLYIYDLSDFETLFESLQRDPMKLIEFAKALEKEKDPEAKLKERVQEIRNTTKTTP